MASAPRRPNRLRHSEGPGASSSSPSSASAPPPSRALCCRPATAVRVQSSRALPPEPKPAVPRALSRSPRIWRVDWRSASTEREGVRPRAPTSLRGAPSAARREGAPPPNAAAGAPAIPKSAMRAAAPVADVGAAVAGLRGVGGQARRGKCASRCAPARNVRRNALRNALSMSRALRRRATNLQMPACSAPAAARDAPALIGSLGRAAGRARPAESGRDAPVRAASPPPTSSATVPTCAYRALARTPVRGALEPARTKSGRGLLACS